MSAIISTKTAEILQQIQERVNRGSYSPTAYERDVTRLLDDLFPFSVLPGIRLFSSEPRGRVAYGFEMDNLFHVRFGEADYIVIVEAKKQAIDVDKGRWNVSYDGERKCAREQVDNHIRTMWEYLKPIARTTELKFVAVVVSSSAQTVAQKADGYRNAELHLCAIGALPELLAERFNLKLAADRPKPEVLRVPQSGFLDLLRLSLPVEQLGHPELASAIRYVDRCRRTLDEALFQRFDPKPERWVINGSAGMGKSVLLAYAAAVLSSGHEIYRSLGMVGVKKASETFATMGFDQDPKRGSIAIMAMSVKQLENIRGWFNLFVEQFQQGDTEGVVRFRPPEFLLCRAGIALAGLGRNWTALLVDEAHDLPSYAAREIAELYARGGLYLVVACDRHQKLRLAGSDAKIVEGLDFTNRSTRLRQVYRNPAPVYIASLALMFRWFADEGPKVIPILEQMREQFGFETTVGAELALEVVMRSDAHPANSWCHTVATFPDVAAAYAALAKEKMGHKEVLWVRFSEEDQDFDYEQLIQRFTYHNCRSRDAHKITDKYIKGQDYPIVVIEGFPGFMDRFEANGGESAEAVETRMWAFRRELYLCASRATAFLYFVCNVEETPEVLRIRNELRRLVAATATPENRSSGGIKSWKFMIRRTDQTRSLDVFADTVSETAQAGKSESPLATAAAVAVVRPTPVPVAITAPNKQPVSAKDETAAVTPERPVQVPPNLRSVSTSPREPSVPQTSLSVAPEKDVERVVSVPITQAPPEPPGTPAKEEPSTPVPSAPEKPQRVVVDLISGPEARRANREAIGRTSIGDVLSAAIPAKEVIPPPASGQGAAPLPARKVVVTSRQPPTPATPERLEPKSEQARAVREPQSNAAIPKSRPVLRVPSGTTVRTLAELLGVKPFTLIGELMGRKIFASLNQTLDADNVVRLCSQRGFKVEFEKPRQPTPPEQ